MQTIFEFGKKQHEVTEKQLAKQRAADTKSGPQAAQTAPK